MESSSRARATATRRPWSMAESIPPRQSLRARLEPRSDVITVFRPQEGVMRRTARRLAVVALVALVFWRLRAQTDRDVVVAQTGQSITVTRIYTGPDGQSHAEELPMK